MKLFSIALVLLGSICIGAASAQNVVTVNVGIKQTLCAQTSIAQVNSKQASLYEALSVYPNPAMESITIAIAETMQTKSLEITISNVLGQTVWSDAAEASTDVRKTDMRKEISIAFLPQGIYCIRVLLGGVAAMRTVVVQR